MKIFGKRQTKANPASESMLYLSPLAEPSTRNAKEFYIEGYQLNAIVGRAINKLQRAIGNLELELHRNGKAIDQQEFRKLIPALFRPNPMEAWDTFIGGAFIDYFCTGEIFFSAVTAGQNKLVELWRQTPIHMKVEAGMGGLPKSYIFDAGGKKTVWEVNPIDGASEMFFYKALDPLNYWRGQSPLKAASLSIDAHNYGLIWNFSLLKNGARPSGIMKFKGTPGRDALARLKEFFKKAIQGANNAGEIPMLVDGAEWQEVGQNAKDMDYVKTMKETAKYIATTLGVPLPLVDNDSTTFNNMSEAKEEFYIDTVIPQFNSFLAQFNPWLQRFIGPGLEVKVNMDNIPALETVRNRKFDRMIKGVAGMVITIDEAREELGFAPLGGMAATLLIGANTRPIDQAGQTMTPDQTQEAANLRKAGFTELEIARIITLPASEYTSFQ